MQIIIQFSNRNLNIKELCQAIKIFSKKHEKYNFLLVGPQDQLHTIKDEKNVKILDIKNEEDSILKTIQFVKKGNSLILSYTDLNNFVEDANNSLNFKKEAKTLVTGTLFKTYDYKKPLMLVNLDKTCEKDFSNTNILESISLFKEYLNKNNQDKTYKICGFSKNQTSKMFELLKTDDSFKGEILPKDLLDANLDFVFLNQDYINGFLEGFENAFNATKKIKERKINDTISIKLANYFTRSIETQIDNALTNKARSRGTILLGYSSPIIFGKVDDDLNSILNSLNTIIF